MKTIILKVVSIFSVICVIIMMGQKIHSLNIELENSINNEKAYIAENSELVKNNRVFKFTINHLKYCNDSLTLAMKKVANENNIKDKKIKALQYQIEYFSKQDTIFVKDTIFKEPGFILDTCIMDEWNTSCLHLAYPGTISLNNQYKNEKYIVLNSHKEPIKPRKWFLPRWFTRKHTVIEVLIVDKNPYVKTPTQRYIEVIDN